MISTVLDERRLPSLRGDAGHRPLPLLDDRLDDLGERPADLPPAARAGRSPSATTATSSTPASCSSQLDGRPGAPAGLDRHGAADRAARRRAGRGHGRGPRQRPAARPRRVQPRRSSTSAGSSASATRTASGRSSWAGCPRTGDGGRLVDDGLWGDDDAAAGWCLSSETAALDIVGAEYVRDVEPGEIVILEPGQAPRSVRYAEPRPRRCASSSSSTSPGPTRTWRAATCTRRAARWAMQLALRAPGRGRPRHAGPGHRRAGRGRATPRRRGLPYREGMYRNRYAGRTFIQPSQGLRHRGVTIKLNPLREVVARQAPDRRRRLDRARHDDEADRRAAAQGRRDARSTSGSARRRSTTRASTASTRPIETELIASTHTEDADPRVHRGRLAGLPLDPRRARGARPAVRAVLLRLLRRQLPRARPVRRGEPQVHARGAGRRGRCVTGAMERRGRRYRAPGVDVDAGERAVELMRGHVESTRRPRGRRRARRVRRRLRDPAGLPRAAAGRLDRRRRHQDRDRRRRSGGSTRSASTSWRCAPTTSSARAPSRSRSSTTWRSASSTRSAWPSSSAASRPAAARPGARWSAARRPSTRA